jgi:alpha-D-ribose 1-methylphosphonate 5-phosphate C-P lyase
MRQSRDSIVNFGEVKVWVVYSISGMVVNASVVGNREIIQIIGNGTNGMAVNVSSAVKIAEYYTIGTVTNVNVAAKI